MVDHSPPLPSITLCVGAVVLREGKVLFIRQAYGKLKGKWSLPWGFIDGRNPDGSFETPDRAAVRETLEEAGVTAELAFLIPQDRISQTAHTGLPGRPPGCGP